MKGFDLTSVINQIEEKAERISLIIIDVIQNRFNQLIKLEPLIYAPNRWRSFLVLPRSEKVKYKSKLSKVRTM